jgi:hypothetical protein
MEDRANQRDLKIIQRNLDAIKNQIRFVQSKANRLNKNTEPLKRILRQLDEYLKEIGENKDANL